MRLTTILLIFLALIAMGGCKQGVGERCQVTSDCDDDLICCVGEGQRSVGGTCQRQEECELTTPDAGVDSGEDASDDDSEVTDSKEPDAKPDTAVDAPKEAAVPDTAPDTTPEPDTAPDMTTPPDLEPDTVDAAAD